MQDEHAIITSEEFIGGLRSLYDRLKNSQNILLATHENPDGDGLGAMFSLSLFLKQIGKHPFPFSYDKLPESLQFLPGSVSVQHTLPENDIFDLVIGLDYGDIERLHLRPTFLDESRFVTIDHHVASRPFGDLQIVYPDLSSTSEIAYWFFRNNSLAISKDIALNLLTGILVDTGGFSHITTSPQVFEVGSELLKSGVVPSKVLRESLDTRGEAALKIWGRALARIREVKEIGMLYSYILKDDLDEHGATFDDVAGLISLLNTAPTSRFTVLLVEYEKGVVKGSLRSERFKGVDVSEIAASLGGGGHKYAAGFTREGSMDDIVEDIKQVVLGFGGTSDKKTYDILPPKR